MIGTNVGGSQPGREVGGSGVERRGAADQPLFGIGVVEAGDQLLQPGLQGRNTGAWVRGGRTHCRDCCGELVRAGGELLRLGEGGRVGQLGRS